MEMYVEPVDDLIKTEFLPSLFGKDAPLDETYTNLMTVNTGDGGLGIKNLVSEAKQQYEFSKTITRPHTHSIEQQNFQMLETDDEGRNIETLKKLCREEKEKKEKEKMEKIISSLPKHVTDYVYQAQDKGASSWLNTIPMKEQHLDLNKEEFRDALRLRYNMPLDNLPSKCACGEQFTINHALKCMKGGFISNRHDNIRDFLTVLLNKTCTDVQSEPTLIGIENEKMKFKSATLRH